MNVPQREAKSLASFIQHHTDPVHGKQCQVTVYAKDKAGTEHPTGWVSGGIAAAYTQADAYIAKNLPGYTL